jgi:hypothetical protein
MTPCTDYWDSMAWLGNRFIISPSAGRSKIGACETCRLTRICAGHEDRRRTLALPYHDLPRNLRTLKG